MCRSKTVRGLGICCFSATLYTTVIEKVVIGQQIDFKFSLEIYVLGLPEQNKGIRPRLYVSISVAS